MGYIHCSSIAMMSLPGPGQLVLSLNIIIHTQLAIALFPGSLSAIMCVCLTFKPTQKVWVQRSNIYMWVAGGESLPGRSKHTPALNSEPSTHHSSELAVGDK